MLRHYGVEECRFCLDNYTPERRCRLPRTVNTSMPNIHSLALALFYYIHLVPIAAKGTEWHVTIEFGSWKKNGDKQVKVKLSYVSFSYCLPFLLL